MQLNSETDIAEFVKLVSSESIRSRKSRGEMDMPQKVTREMAVMIDTFRPLRVVKKAHEYEDPSYMYSWHPTT
ncbi:hypothetical protein [uncultured Brevibacillus sp.]|uniref:hypothetical protein n=1 Tax=uncultured Brevibacillus sp. TaxID=169970 RepID=UPI0025926847|nr:hypothetical protein [uncultured Brevibacillus sp.]